MDIDRDIVYHLGTSTWLAWSIFPRFREAVSLCNGCCCSPETSTLSFISSNVPMHFPVTIAMQKLCLMMLFFFLKIKSFARDNSSSWKHVIFLMQSLRRSIVHCAFSPKYTSLSSKLFIAVLVRIAPGGEFKTRSMFISTWLMDCGCWWRTCCCGQAHRLAGPIQHRRLGRPIHFINLNAERNKSENPA